MESPGLPRLDRNAAPQSTAHPRTRAVVTAALVAVGGAWLAWAWRCDLRYAEEHLLPGYAANGAGDVALARVYRIVLAAVGALALALAPRAGRWAGRHGAAATLGLCARMAIALALALVASEAGMRALGLPRPPDATHLTEVRIGETDPRYGWLYVASRATVLHHGERDIEYAIDADHDRAPRVDYAPDPTLPTILFAGESIAAGHGLTWEESLPAHVGRALDAQVVDLGVHGYGMDQAYLRLKDTLPRFQRPVAVVSIYLAPMISRMDAGTHARLVFDGAEPRLVPVGGFFHDLRLAAATRALFPYRDASSIAVAAQIVRETERIARERGAKALFVAPRLERAPERPDRYLYDALFTQQGVDAMDLDFGVEILPSDNHPNAASTRRLADAVVAALRRQLAAR